MSQLETGKKVFLPMSTFVFRNLKGLCDFDANLLHKDLRGDMAHHVKSARDMANVQLFVVPGSDLEDSAAALALARASEMRSLVVATAGVHPYNASAVDHTEESLIALRALVQEGHANEGDGTCRAVGECGLDYSPGFPERNPQQQWFRSQVSMALETQLPLYLHVRNAHEDFMCILSEFGFPLQGPPPVPSVVHCFTGSTEELKQYTAMGFYIGLTGYVIGAGEKKGEDSSEVHAQETLQEWLRIIPADRLVIETDSPYMGFKGCRVTETKKKNQKYPNVPASLKTICEHIAVAAGKPYDQLVQETSANAARFLGLPEEVG